MANFSWFEHEGLFEISDSGTELGVKNQCAGNAAQGKRIPGLRGEHGAELFLSGGELILFDQEVTK